MCSCIQIISEGEVKCAKKKHYCMASEWITESGLLRESGFFKFYELRQIATMKAKGFLIHPGDPYIWQYNKGSDGPYMFKANKEMHELCLKYDIYPCDC